MTRSRIRRLLILGALWLALAPLRPDPSPCLAQGPPQVTSMGGAEGGLDAAEARRLTFLFWAYVAIWALLAAYLVSLGVRLRAVRREIDRMRRRHEGEPPPGR
jgi:CcmD family protein